MSDHESQDKWTEVEIVGLWFLVAGPNSLITFDATFHTQEAARRVAAALNSTANLTALAEAIAAYERSWTAEGIERRSGHMIARLVVDAARALVSSTGSTSDGS